jgi:hypothetical protein
LVKLTKIHAFPAGPDKIAHTLDQAEIKVKLDEIRAAYLAALSPEQKKAAETLDDAR